MGFVIRKNDKGGVVRRISGYFGCDKKTGDVKWWPLGFGYFEILLEDGEEVVAVRCSFRGGIQYPKFTLVWPDRLERPLVDIGRDRGFGRGRLVPDMLAELEWVPGKREEYDKREIVGQLEVMGLEANYVLSMFLGQMAKFA